MLAPLLAAAAVSAATPAPAASVELTAPERGDWTARWALPRPAAALAFARSTDDNRVRTWRVAPAFEIVREGETEVVRRRDRKPFRSVSATVPPRYAELPKDYAPFSPFGGGGVLVHSGRFFACADACADGATWSMKLRATGREILLDGRSLGSRAEWVDRDSGRNLFVGSARPVQTDDFVAVIDPALPSGVRSQLETQLPQYMRRFARELGALQERPMLFVSYDVAHTPGVGRQGGVLPGQVFVHFYGAEWPQRVAEQWFAEDLAWHLAHEAAHLYQHQIFDADSRGAWVHEGAADAMAYLALAEEGGTAADYAALRLTNLPARCERFRAGVSVRDAIAAGRFDAAYRCGMMVHLALDRALRKDGAAGSGLYALWREYQRRVRDGVPGGETTYLAAVAALGGPELAEAARKAVYDTKPDFDAIH